MHRPKNVRKCICLQIYLFAPQYHSTLKQNLNIERNRLFQDCLCGILVTVMLQVRSKLFGDLSAIGKES